MLLFIMSVFIASIFPLLCAGDRQDQRRDSRAVITYNVGDSGGRVGAGRSLTYLYGSGGVDWLT